MMKHHSLAVDFSSLDFEKIDIEVLEDEAKELEGAESSAGEKDKAAKGKGSDESTTPFMISLSSLFLFLEQWVPPFVFWGFFSFLANIGCLLF